MGEASPICDRCGEPLGAYEPLVLELSDGTRVRGGYLALRDSGRGIEARLSHARCLEEERSGSASSLGP